MLLSNSNRKQMKAVANRTSVVYLELSVSPLDALPTLSNVLG